MAEAKSKAEEAKGKARAALDKGTASKKKVERSNNDLRDLIKRIREFLMRESDSLVALYKVIRYCLSPLFTHVIHPEEGADPDSIEAVANQVLELSIPASPLKIRLLADEIKERVRSLSNVDAILEHTKDDVRRAEQLLLDAKRARLSRKTLTAVDKKITSSIFIHPFTTGNTILYFRHHAEGVKTTAETVKHALVGAKTAQMSAEKAIARAKADIGDTETRLAQVTLNKERTQETAHPKIEKATFSLHNAAVSHLESLRVSCSVLEILLEEKSASWPV